MVLTEKQETLLHLACKGTLTKILNMKDEMRLLFETSDSSDSGIFSCKSIEELTKNQESAILISAYPCFDFLIENFKKNPDFMEIEDELPTSPGLLLHYFTCLNHLEGVKTLLKEPFLVSANTLNKNKLSALWIASWHNKTKLGILTIVISF